MTLNGYLLGLVVGGALIATSNATKETVNTSKIYDILTVTFIVIHAQVFRNERSSTDFYMKLYYGLMNPNFLI